MDNMGNFNIMDFFGNLFITLITIISPLVLKRFNPSSGRYFVNKKNNFFKKYWLLYKKLYWEGDQTVDYVRCVLVFVQIFLCLFCTPVFIGIVVSMLSDFFINNFDVYIIDKITYMIEIFLIKAIVLLFILIEMAAAVTSSDKWKTLFTKCCVCGVKFFCNMGVIAILYLVDKKAVSLSVNYTIFYFFLFYLIVSFLFVFYLANPYDTETTMKVYFNEDYLKHISGIKKCFYTTINEKINFYEAISYDKEEITLKLQTKCNYSKVGKYPIIFTVISKNNPKKKTEFTSFIYVKKRKVKRSSTNISCYLDLTVCVATFALPIILLLVVFYLK